MVLLDRKKEKCRKVMILYKLRDNLRSVVTPFIHYSKILCLESVGGFLNACVKLKLSFILRSFRVVHVEQEVQIVSSRDEIVQIKVVTVMIKKNEYAVARLPL